MELRSLHLHRPTPPPAEEGQQGQARGEEGEGRGFGGGGQDQWVRRWKRERVNSNWEIQIEYHRADQPSRRDTKIIQVNFKYVDQGPTKIDKAGLGVKRGYRTVVGQFEM